MKRFSIFATYLIALLLTVSAFAQNPQDPQSVRRQKGLHRGKKIRQMDANNDGVISRDEWKGRPKRFNRLDANHDGMITKEELRARRHKRLNPPGI